MFQCQVDGGSFTACPGSFTPAAPLVDGAHTFGVKAIDPALNESTVTTHSWTVDTVAPQTTIDAQPPSLTSSRSAQLSFHATDSGSGVAGFECSLDGAAYASCANPVSYSGLADGPHSFGVRAIDNVGNVDASPATASWTVDATPPAPPLITSAPSDPSADTTPTFAFTDSDSTAVFRCQVDGGSFTVCPGSFTPAAPLVDGAHTFGVKAIDPALNESTLTTRSWTVDSVAPQTTIDAAPPSLTSSRSAHLAFHGTDNGSGVAGYQCALDGAAYAGCTNPVDYSGLADGSHSFGVRAIDNAGNVDASAATASWTVDATPPPAPLITSAPPDPSADPTPTFAFTDSDATAVFRCQVDGGSFTACPGSFTPAALGDGAHTFGVKAIDPALNESTLTTRSWTVDSLAPQTTIDAHPPSLTSSSAQLSFHGTDSGSGVAGFECSLDGAAYASCANPVSYSGLADGPHSFGVRAIDNVGNVDASPATASWTVDAVAPQTTIDAHPPSLTSSRSAQLSFHGTDSGSGVAGYECSLDGAAYASCANPVSYSGLADGPHSFGVRAIDNVGNVDASPATASWTVDATPPAPPLITSAPSDPSADHDPDVRIHRQRLDGGVPVPGRRRLVHGLPGELHPRAPLGDGAHTFGVKAIDPALNESTLTTHSWTVDTVHPLVSIDQTPPLLTNQTEAQFTFAANKPGSSYRCALDGGPFASCGSPKLYSGLGDGVAHLCGLCDLACPGRPGQRRTRGRSTPFHRRQRSPRARPPPARAPRRRSPSRAARPRRRSRAVSTARASSRARRRRRTRGWATATTPSASRPSTRRATRTPRLPRTRGGSAERARRSRTSDRPPTSATSERSVGYGRLQLHWRNPSDSDFDHVAVFVATKRSTPPRTIVFSGRSQTYVNKRFKNGLYYRYLIVSYDHAENAAGGTPVTVPPNVLLKGAGDGRIVHAPPLLRWTAVRKATFYNVQVFHRGQKILSAWPAKARRKLGRRWAYGGRHFTLRAGIYAWYVWPAFGPRAKSRYGQLLGEGTFKLR